MLGFEPGISSRHPDSFRNGIRCVSNSAVVWKLTEVGIVEMNAIYHQFVGVKNV